jgi:hypothetical protein
MFLAMRVLPLLLLTALLPGCFDAVTTDVKLDLAAGKVHVVQRYVGATPDLMHCEDTTVAACVDGIRGVIEQDRKELADGGAEAASVGVVLTDGRLDVLYVYDASVDAKLLASAGLSFLHMEEHTDKQWLARKPGRREVAMMELPTDGGINAVSIDGRYRVIEGQLAEAPVRLFLFRGKSAAVHSEWTATTQDADGKTLPATPAPVWVTSQAGLEDAIRAAGLVVEVPK